ncbi:hypothetical protein Gotri_012694, partial [Gossypium trilobum]|nr:hypothetical protein [Gossypium trilobum]
VIDGNPWTFNKHILVLCKRKSGEDPLRVPLYSVDYWVQIHDLTMGLMSKSFYPVQIVYGKKEIPFEWGLSIKVIPRQIGCHPRFLLWSADDDRASAILGIKLDCRTNEVRDIDEVMHPHDLTMVEDFPMVLGEGKKRPHTSRFFFVSTVTNLERARKPTAMKILSWNVWGLKSPRAMCCLRLIEEARHCQSWDLLCRLSSNDPTPWLVLKVVGVHGSRANFLLEIYKNGWTGECHTLNLVNPRKMANRCEAPTKCMRKNLEIRSSSRACLMRVTAKGMVNRWMFQPPGKPDSSSWYDFDRVRMLRSINTVGSE